MWLDNSLKRLATLASSLFLAADASNRPILKLSYKLTGRYPEMGLRLRSTIAAHAKHFVNFLLEASSIQDTSGKPPLPSVGS